MEVTIFPYKYSFYEIHITNVKHIEIKNNLANLSRNINTFTQNENFYGNVLILTFDENIIL